MAQTQLEAARAGQATPAMEAVAAAEGVALDSLIKLVAEGKVAIPRQPGPHQPQALRRGPGPPGQG